MTLLPLRVLAVASPCGSSFTTRVDLRASSASVYLRRESDRATWHCTVTSVPEILSSSSTENTRALDLTTLLLSLYHGHAHDAAASPPLELHRRAVAIDTTPDALLPLWMNVRVAVRTVSSSSPTTNTVDHTDDNDVRFTLLFAPSKVNIEHSAHDAVLVGETKQVLRLRSVGVAFASACVNWTSAPTLGIASGARYLQVVEDGVRLQRLARVDVTLDLLHPCGQDGSPVLYVVSVGGRVVKPNQTASYGDANRELQHTIAQFRLKLPPKGCLLQVVVLPGSAFVLDGSSLTIRECT